MAFDAIANLSGALPAASGDRSGSPARSEATQPQVDSPRRSAPTNPPVNTQLPDVKAQLEAVVRTLQESQSNLSFSVDEGTGKTVVRVVRRSTGEVVRQIPSEEALAISASLQRGEPLTSLGFDRWS